MARRKAIGVTPRVLKERAGDSGALDSKETRWPKPRS